MNRLKNNKINKISNLFIKKGAITWKEFNIFTLDFETIPICGTHIAYMWSITYCINTNKYTKSEISLTLNRLGEYNLIQKAINFLKQNMTNKKTIVYCHNLTFDGIFIIRNLIIKYNPQILIRNGRIYQIICNSITFRCSLNLIPGKLNDLAKHFLNTQKEDIDFTKINLNNLYSKINLINNYCKQDSLILFNVIIKFTILIKSLFDINTYETLSMLTISALSYHIYKKNYMNTNKIYNNKNDNIFNTLQNSYKGGICELYIPYGENLFYYDVNSAYPNVMATQPMPTGEPEIINNITLNDFFGFITVEIEIKEGIKYPFIGFKKDKTILYPTGCFTTTLFSEELKYAIKIGHVKTYTILTAIKFSKDYIFTDFIQNLYKERFKKDHNQSYKYLYKIIMNSLYGRFALKKDINITKLIKTYEYDDYELLYNTHIIVQLKNKMLLNLTYDFNNKQCLTNNINIIPNTSSESINKLTAIVKENNSKYIKFENSVQISSAITSYARIHLQKYKEFCSQNNINIYYSDTDSIIVDKELPTYMISNELGSLKLEYIIKRAYFIAPKVYYLIDNHGKEILKFKGVTNPIKPLKENNFKNWLKKNNNFINIIDYKPIQKKIYHLKFNSGIIEKNINLFLTKRNKIYNNNDWINTQNLHINKKGDII